MSAKRVHQAVHKPHTDKQFSLPTAPGVDNDKLIDDHTGTKLNMSGPVPMMYDVNQLRLPPNPDPRTGLHRLDLLWRVGDIGKWWLSGPKSAIAWHRLKNESVSRETAERYGVRLRVKRPLGSGCEEEVR